MTAGSAAKARLLFIGGSDLHERMIVTAENIRNVGSTDLHKLLAGRAPVERLHVTRHFFRQQGRPKLGKYDCVVNLVTDPDQNPKVLENVRKLLRGYAGRIVNRPEAVLRSTRDQVAKRLAGTPDLIVPKTLRLRINKPDFVVQAVERAEFQFPVIVRRAGSHTGVILGVFDDPDALRAACRGEGDHIVTEFVDFRSEDGLYRKYRSFFIGRHVILRHMIVSDHWDIHAKDRDRALDEWPEHTVEERRLFETPQGAFPERVLQCQTAIRERMGLDFFGLDYGIVPDGRLVLFEANATMNFFPFVPDPRIAYVRNCERPAQQAFWQLLGLTDGTLATGADEMATA